MKEDSPDGWKEKGTLEEPNTDDNGGGPGHQHVQTIETITDWKLTSRTREIYYNQCKTYRDRDHLRTWAGFETCSWADQLSGLVSNSSAQIYYRSRDDRFLVNERRMRSVGTLGTSNAL